MGMKLLTIAAVAIAVVMIARQAEAASKWKTIPGYVPGTGYQT